MTPHITALAALTEDETGGPFDTISGLPVHPLVVHGAVVLLPLAALGLIVIVLVPRWRRTLGWLVLGGLLVAAGAAFAAAESGESLAAHVGTPALHAELGDQLPIMAFGLLVVATTWFALARRDERPPAGTRTVTKVMAVVAILAAVVNLVWVFRVGHTGAEAVWGGRISATSSDTAGSSESAGPAESADPSASASASGTAQVLTMADVAAHGSAADCWTAVHGDVYDLTAWESEHPGGLETIVAMCGTDATAAYDDQHGTQRKPNEVLAGFQIGVLG